MGGTGERYEVAVVGGGIVGLATAYAVLSHSPSTSLLLIEKEDSLGFHQTGRNSGVLHSGHLLQARVLEGGALSPRSNGDAAIL